MKILFSILLFLICCNGFAANFYVNISTGDNTNPGTIGSPWRDLVKVNISFGSMSSGDSVLLFSGQTFPGAILVNTAGIKFGIYGGTAKATISGLVTVTGWTLVSSGLYKASLTAPNDLRYVTVDGINVEWARTPNKGQGTNSYYYVNSFSNGTPKTITDNELPLSPSRVGNRFALKGETWYISLFKCTTQVGTTLTYVPGSLNLLGVNPFARYANQFSGFVFTGNIVDCNQVGEWAYDSTANELYLYTGATNPNTLTIKAASLNRGIDMQALSGISVENIKVEGFNQVGVYAKNGGGTLKVKNCTIDGSGGYGVLFSNTPNIIIEDDTVKNCYGIGLRLPTNSINGASVQRNYLDSTNCPFETMFYWGSDLDGDGIACGMNNQTTSYNKIKAAAYSGLWFTGSNVMIERNEITGYSRWLTDNGGGYTHALTGAGAYPVYTNRIFRNNWVHDATGYIYGYSISITPATKGLYNDDQSMNVFYDNNLVSFVDIGSSNNVDSNMSFHDNTIIASQGINMFDKSFNKVELFNFTRNIVSNINSNSITYYYINNSFGNTQTILQAMANLGILDSNICNSGSSGYGTETYASPGVGYKRTLYNLPQWQTTTGKSADDTLVPFLQFANDGRKLVVNWTGSPAVIGLPGVYKDYAGNTYTNAITLPAYGYKLLYYINAVPILPGSKLKAKAG